jgi:hypothetical protein
MPSQDNASAPMATGMDSHAFSVLLDRDGTPHLSHAHVLKIASGTVSTAEHAQVQTDSGISNLMTVFVESETGMAPNVSFALATPTGMAKFALLVLAADFGTLWIWFVNALMKLNGMVLTASRHVQMVRF